MQQREVSVLCAGGLGSLGTLAGSWLATTGAAHLSLLGRTGKLTSHLTPIHDTAPGVIITAAALNPASQEDTSAAMCLPKEGNQDTAGPMAILGVMHASGTLADALVSRQTMHGIRTVAAAKVSPAQNLIAKGGPHAVGSHLGFSSIAALLGAAGQANYAGANAALDSAMLQQSAMGVSACSLQWGAWGGIGMAAQDPSIGMRLARGGVDLITPTQGLATLAAVLSGSHSPAQPLQAYSPMIAVLPITDLPAFQKQLPAGSAFWQELQQHVTHHSTAAKLNASSRSRLPAALPLPESKSAPALQHSKEGSKHPQAPRHISATASTPEILQVVTGTVQEVLGKSLSSDASLMESGLDSLGAVELRNALAARFSIDLPATLTFDYPSVAAIASFLQQEISPTPGSASQTEPALNLDASQLHHFPSFPSALSLDQYRADPFLGSTATSMNVAPPGAVQTGPVLRDPSASAHQHMTTPSPETLQKVLQAVKEVVGGDVAPDDSLMEAGLDSLGAVELRNALSASFKVDLPATLTFDHPSAAAVALRLSEPALASEPGQEEAMMPQDTGSSLSLHPMQPHGLAMGSALQPAAICIKGVSAR